MKYLTDFRKTVETGMDPRPLSLLFPLLRLIQPYISKGALFSNY